MTVADVEPEALNADAAFPLSARVCGEPGASSVMVTVAMRWPAPRGANVTVIVQFALGARAALHALFMMKSFGFAPPRITEKMFSFAVPEFVRMTFCGSPVVPWVIAGNQTFPGMSVTADAAGTPVPVMGID